MTTTHRIHKPHAYRVGHHDQPLLLVARWLELTAAVGTLRDSYARIERKRRRDTELVMALALEGSDSSDEVRFRAGHLPRHAALVLTRPPGTQAYAIEATSDGDE